MDKKQTLNYDGSIDCSDDIPDCVDRYPAEVEQKIEQALDEMVFTVDEPTTPETPSSHIVTVLGYVVKVNFRSNGTCACTCACNGANIHCAQSSEDKALAAVEAIIRKLTGVKAPVHNC